MKVLCVCQGGNSRSVGLAYVLKKLYKIDALSCGYRDNHVDTMNMLYRWADYIILMREKFRPVVPEEFKGKVRVIDVGTDRYLNISNELKSMCKRGWEDLKL